MSKEDLTPFDSARARENQLKSAKKRHENCVKRDMLFKMFQKRLMGKKKVNDQDIVSLGDDLEGYEVGKRVTRALLDLDIIREAAKKTGNVRGYIELLKFAGVHFDQSDETLGGAENPLNIATGPITPEQVKKISKQLEEDC